MTPHQHSCTGLTSETLDALFAFSELDELFSSRADDADVLLAFADGANSEALAGWSLTNGLAQPTETSQCNAFNAARALSAATTPPCFDGSATTLPLTVYHQSSAALQHCAMSAPVSRHSSTGTISASLVQHDAFSAPVQRSIHAGAATCQPTSYSAAASQHCTAQPITSCLNPEHLQPATVDMPSDLASPAPVEPPTPSNADAQLTRYSIPSAQPSTFTASAVSQHGDGSTSQQLHSGIQVPASTVKTGVGAGLSEYGVPEVELLSVRTDNPTHSMLCTAELLSVPWPGTPAFQPGPALMRSAEVHSAGHSKQLQQQRCTAGSCKTVSDPVINAGAASCSAFAKQPAQQQTSQAGRVGRPRMARSPEAGGKRTRGEREKERLAGLQAQVDSKALEVEILAAQNDTLRDRQVLLSELVEFREMTVDFVRRRLLPTAATDKLSPLSASYPWLVQNITETPLMPGVIKEFKDPLFCPVPGSQLPLEYFKTLSVQELLMHYERTVAYMSQLLLEADAPRNPALATTAMSKLESFMQEFQFTMGTITLCNPSGFKCRGMCCDPSRPMPPPDDYWLPVISALTMSDRQRRRIANLYGLCRRRLLDIASEREQLGAEMQELMSSGFFDVKSTVQQEELIEKLHSNIMREKGITVLVSGFIRTRVWNAIQKARCVTVAYPYVPDIVAIAAIIYEELNGPGSPALSLSSPSPSPPPPLA